MIFQNRVLIIGGGLAGLSAAYHVKRLNTLLVERESEVGGTARSFKINDFTFDFTGHLLHLHTPYTKKLINRLLKGNFYRCFRNASIFSHNVETPYPFQANTHGLPSQVINDCVMGFVETWLKPKRPISNYAQLDFNTWSGRTFGPGISRHFMIPYNEKLYQVKASKMSCDWCGPFVPTPKIEEVLRGALERQDKRFGYNTEFLYPRTGGIQALPQALARGVRDIRLNTSLLSINWKTKKATLSSGEIVSYSNMINSLPLVELLKRMDYLPISVKRALKKLKFASILCLNIGVKRAKISARSWIYFPENKYPFYRVGFPMNFTPHAVPKGCSSMYVEVPMKSVQGLSNDQILKRVRDGLIDARILKRTDKLPVVQFLPIRYAYVIFNKHRPAALKTIFHFLDQNNIQTIGRYGAWKYSFMEEAILDGKKAAEKILASQTN